MTNADDILVDTTRKASADVYLDEPCMYDDGGAHARTGGRPIEYQDPATRLCVLIGVCGSASKSYNNQNVRAPVVRSLGYECAEQPTVAGTSRVKSMKGRYLPASS